MQRQYIIQVSSWLYITKKMTQDARSLFFPPLNYIFYKPVFSKIFHTNLLQMIKQYSSILKTISHLIIVLRYRNVLFPLSNHIFNQHLSYFTYQFIINDNTVFQLFKIMYHQRCCKSRILQLKPSKFFQNHIQYLFESVIAKNFSLNFLILLCIIVN